MRRTRGIKLGSVPIGGGAPVSVQSMTNTDTRDVEATLGQIAELAAAGCDIVRVAIPDRAAAAALERIVADSALPVVADIHFDWRLAIAAIGAGAAGIRINPGNVGGAKRVARIAAAAAERGVVLRVGVNGGSLEAELHARHGGATPAALVESALGHCALCEAAGCRLLKVSVKASDVSTTVAACRLFAAQSDIPLHIGVTEAGTRLRGTVKSAVAIGALLLDGIGETLRVSLAAPPVEEVRVALRILEAVGARPAEPDVIACPTCGRTGIPVMELAEAVEAEIERLHRQGLRITLGKVAIMGCAVNGPGEARDADVGIAGGKGRGVLFRHGEIVETLPEDRLLEVLLGELRRHAVPRNASGGASASGRLRQ